MCKIEGETTSLSQLLVRNGFALNVEASATGRFQADEARAKEDRQGLWKGCFVAPREFRAGKKDGALLGAACRADRDREIREALFPEDLVMPAGCNIKGKYAVRARVTGNLGIYHLQACRSYPGLTTGSLVLFRGRCAGRRVPQGLQLPINHEEQMTLAKPPLPV